MCPSSSVSAMLTFSLWLFHSSFGNGGLCRLVSTLCCGALLSPDQLPRSPELSMGSGLLCREPSTAGQADVPPSGSLCRPEGTQAGYCSALVGKQQDPMLGFCAATLGTGKAVQSSSQQRGASRASLHLRAALPSPPL